MSTSFTPGQIEAFRRQAKKDARTLTITHSMALDAIARQHGHANWSMLLKNNRSLETAATVSPRRSAAARARGHGRYRHYLHGDLHEDGGGLYYCARCDVFFPASHFTPSPHHTDADDGERYLDSLARWTAEELFGAEPGFRPKDAANILAASAVSARAKREASYSDFYRWVCARRGLGGQAGDLVADIRSDKSFPVAAKSHSEIRDYLSRYGAHVTSAFDSAWAQFNGVVEEDPGPKLISLAQALAQKLGITVDEAEELVDASYIENTGNSGQVVSSYYFNFEGHASQTLASKLRKKFGSLQVEVDLNFFENVRPD